MTGIKLEPVDTWFFRDGAPFTAENSLYGAVTSLFPPHPTTVAGALRAALAARRGWNGRGRWPREFCAVLGDGPDDLGLLSLDGPFILRDDSPVFSVPRHLLGLPDDGRWAPGALLRPGDPARCDLGDAVRLPEPLLDTPEAKQDPAALKEAENLWLTAAGMNAVLNGNLPGRPEIVPGAELWSVEPRTGIQLDPHTRTAQEGMLYNARHVRPARGVGLGMRVAGLPADWTLPFGQLGSLGGESRLAEFREWNGNLGLECPLPAIRQSGRAAVIALTPLDISPECCLGRQPLDDAGAARVVSACLPRPLRVGGWNTLARRPLPLRSVLPAGSALFCELDAPERFAASVGADGVLRLGARRQWGFGVAAVGLWPGEQE